MLGLTGAVVVNEELAVFALLTLLAASGVGIAVYAAVVVRQTGAIPVFAILAVGLLWMVAVCARGMVGKL